MKATNAGSDRDNQPPLTLAEQEAYRQFEASDRAGRALFHPWVAGGAATPHCLGFFEGICRFGVMFLDGYYSVENGQWYHRENEDDVPVPVGNPLEEAWQRAMVVKAQLREELDIGAFFIPVVVFTDMTPDDDILDEVRNRKVRVLWGLDDLVERLIELPERDDLYPRLNGQFIAREIEVLSREAPRKAPAPEQMALDLGGGSLVLQRAETVNIYLSIAATTGAGSDAPPLVLQHVETVNIYVTIAAPGDTDEGPPQATVEGR